MAITKSLAVTILAAGIAGFVSIFIMPSDLSSGSEYFLVHAIPYVSMLLIGIGVASLKANSLQTRNSDVTATRPSPTPSDKGSALNSSILRSKVVGCSVIAVGVVCFFAMIALSGYFAGARPVKAIPEIGLMYAFNQHGKIVYLSHFESLLMTAFFPFSAMTMVLGGFIFNNWSADQAKTR